MNRDESSAPRHSASSPLTVCVAWKDIRNPAAGGAERVLHDLSRRWVQSGHAVVHLVPGFPGAPKTDTVDGIRIERVGNGVLSFFRLARVYRRKYRGQAARLIDVFTCFGSGAVAGPGPRTRALLIHHIQDRNWFHQTVFPGVPRGLMRLIGPAGFLLEKWNLRLLARRFPGPVLTISQSTRKELQGYGFRPDRIHIFRPGLSLAPLPSIESSAPKEPVFTVLLLGPRRSKRPLETLKAFALFQQKHPDTALWIAGWGTEHRRLAAWADRHGVRSVRVQGRLDEAAKKDAMQRAHVLCTTPVKEGWGLVVTEANAMGTPALGYDVPGLREALAAGGGRSCAPCPTALADELAALYRCWKETPSVYDDLRRRALESSRTFTVDAMVGDVARALSSGQPEPC